MPITRRTLVTAVKHKRFSGLVQQRERALVCLLKFGFKRLNLRFVSGARRLKVINESHVKSLQDAATIVHVAFSADTL